MVRTNRLFRNQFYHLKITLEIKDSILESIDSDIEPFWVQYNCLLYLFKSICK